MTDLTTINVSSKMAHRYYLSTRYQHDEGILAWKNKPIAATKDKTYLVGANYPPQIYLTAPRDGMQRCHSYIGRAFQWVRAFREEAMPLAWSVSRHDSGMHDPTQLPES